MDGQSESTEIVNHPLKQVSNGSTEWPALRKNLLTVVVFPWERFSVSPLALDSLLENCKINFKLIYIDGNSPEHIQQQIKQKLAGRSNTTLLRYEHYLRPILARNIGVQQVDTPYVALVANDVYIYPGAIEAMMRCAIEEKADAVTPVVLIGRPETQVIHAAGGTVSLYDNNGQTWLNNNPKYEWKHLNEVAAELKREPANLAELHCWLAKTDSLRRTGDAEGNSDIHIHTFGQWDYGLIHQKLGMHMIFEPAAVTVYMSPIGLGTKPYDLPFFFSVWSEKLAGKALYQLAEKHGLSPDWPRKSHILSWVGSHRRIPMEPLINGTKAAFDAVGIPKIGTAIQKLVYQPTEILFNQTFMLSADPIKRSSHRAEIQGRYLKPEGIVLEPSAINSVSSVGKTLNGFR